MSSNQNEPEFKVVCLHRSQGCNWIGLKNEFKSHADRDCLYAEMTCQFTGCQMKFIRMHQKEHEEKCPHKEIACKHCNNVIVKERNIEAHYEQCEMVLVTCPNDGCGIMLQRRKMSEHEEKDCPFQVIECSFKMVGCDIKILRRDLNQHLRDANIRHTEFLLQNYAAQKQELTDTKNKLQTVEKQLETSNKEIENLQTELEDTKSDLNQTNGAITSLYKLSAAQSGKIIDSQNELNAVKQKLTENETKLKKIENEAWNIKQETKVQNETLERHRDIHFKTLTLTDTLSKGVGYLVQHLLETPVNLFKAIDVDHGVSKSGILPMEKIEFCDVSFNFDAFNASIFLDHQTYKTRTGKLLSKMEGGAIYYIDENNVFFKLILMENRCLWVQNVPDLVCQTGKKMYRNTHLIVFDNSKRQPTNYNICININGFTNDNSIISMYVLNDPEQPMNQLEYLQANDNILWDSCKSARNEIVFFIEKKKTVL
uniref:TRAF-type domain-containing protein n=1 Tax=Clytia hemisphaerica TaxID=252671 RepID=A0A7M5UZH2_9CNID